MNYPEIFKKAWHITTEHRYLRVLGSLASLFAMLIGILRIRYIWPTPIGTGRDIWQYLLTHTANPLGWAILIGVALLALYALAFIFNVISEGGIISAIAKMYDHQAQLNFSKTVSLGLQSFLPLTEFRVLTNAFHIGSYILYILLFRFYLNIYLPGNTIIQDFMPLLIIFGVIITLTTILLNYADYHLVIHKSSVIDSIRKSSLLVVFHLQETLLITLLLILMVIRTLLNLLLIFGLPAIAVYIATFTQVLLPYTAALAVAATFVILLFIWSVIISGTLTVFTTAVWTLTFLELEKKQEHKILMSEPDL
ncbi:MAG: hypothetical protein HY817_00270 [Candidatus Abawacabacteria bacterium]|nr:hypothetical protein [Candidatus Abawacabacteria bacterium]